MCSAFFSRYFFGTQKSNSPKSAPRFFSRFCFLNDFTFFQKHYVFLHSFDQIAKIEVALDIDFPKMGSAFFSAFLFFGMQNASSQKWAPRFFSAFFFSTHRNLVKFTTV